MRSDDDIAGRRDAAHLHPAFDDHDERKGHSAGLEENFAGTNLTHAAMRGNALDLRSRQRWKCSFSLRRTYGSERRSDLGHDTRSVIPTNIGR